MNLFPFISLLSHGLVVAGKDETIAVQRETIDDLRESLRAERDLRAATEKRILELVEKSMTPPPAPERRRLHRPEEPSAQPETLDLTMVNPSDNEALALLAMREVPQGAKTSSSALLRSMERIRSQVIEAHAARSRDASTPGIIPAGVASMISAAEQRGAEAVTHG